MLERTRDVACGREYVPNGLQRKLALHFVENEHIFGARGCDDDAAALASQRQHMIRATVLRRKLPDECAIKRVRRFRVDPFERHARELSDDRLRRVLINALFLQNLDELAAWRLLLKSRRAE